MSFVQSSNFASPKSQSLIYPSLSSKTFSGFRSVDNCFCHLEILTGSLNGSIWFLFSRNEKFSTILWVGWSVGQIGNTGTYQVEMDEVLHEQ